LSSQTERFARNEWLFREVNERIAEVNQDFELDGRLDFLCECGREECLETVDLSRDEYRTVRDDGARFLVKPGHEEPSVERVVIRAETYLVVEKLGAAGEESEDHDPRS
jgi:hypothetical protein